MFEEFLHFHNLWSGTKTFGLKSTSQQKSCKAYEIGQFCQKTNPLHICLRSALTPIMPTETQHRIPDFCTPGRWKMDYHLTPSHGATGRAGSKIDIFGHLAFGIYNRYHLNAQGCY